MVLSTYIPLISGMAHRGAGRYRSHRVAGPAVSRVRGRFSHGRVDDLESLSRHGLHHLVVPHPPSLSARRSFSEHVACADEGVAAEYRRVIDLYVAAALGGDQPHADAGPAVRRRVPAVGLRRRLVLEVDPEGRLPASVVIVPAPLRGWDSWPSGVIGWRPTVRPNRNALRAKDRLYGRLRFNGRH